MILDDFVSLVFPQICISCKRPLIKPEKWLCLYCKAEMPLNENGPLFHREISNKFLGRVGLNSAFAYLKFQKMGVTQAVLHHIKYKGGADLARYLGQCLGEQIPSPIAESIDFIVPIPLHRQKQRQRGFNQSAYFGEGISEAIKIRMEPGLVKRKKYTDTQTRKSKTERWSNVEGIFEVTQSINLINKHIMVVDDVVTTGATLENCFSELQKAGVSKLSLACLAMAK